MLEFKSDIIDNFLPSRTYSFECQSYKALIHLLTELYLNIGSLENVKVTLHDGIFINSIYTTNSGISIYIDNRFIFNYWRGVLHRYCPCVRNPFVQVNPHVKTFMRIRLRELFTPYRSNIVPLPYFALIFAIRKTIFCPSNGFSYYSDYYKKYIYMPCCNPIPMTIKGELKDYTIYVPCGRCYNCQCAKRGAFALRCRSEMQLNKIRGSNYFVTLTYDDNHLFTIQSRRKAVDYLNMQYLKLEKDREYNIFLLEKKKISLFMRKLRRHLKDRFDIRDYKFILSGEYGSVHNRPHYHFLFFSPQYIREDFFHDLLSELWLNGSNKVELMHDANINYVGKHSVKSDFGCQYQQRFAPSFMIYSTKRGAVGSHLKHDPFYWRLYQSKQKYIRMGKYVYYFPRYLQKAFHPDNLSELELITLERDTGEMFDRHMFLHDNGNTPYFLKASLMREDCLKRNKYEKMRLLKKVKKLRKLI